MPKISKLSFFALMILIIAMITAVGWATYRSCHHRYTFVLVHGAYGGGWGFRQLDGLLTRHGQKVYRPTLTGQGERTHLASPSVNLDMHIQDIVNTILFEDLHDVVLVGHSYGGMVITGVADRIPDRIKCVIYLDAIVPIDGESVNTTARGALHHPGVVPLDATGSMAAPSKYPAGAPLPHDEPQPAGTYTQPIHLINQAIAKRIPTTFVLYVTDGSDLENARFYPFYLRARENGWSVKTFSSTHNAQWTHPLELAALLESIP